MERLTETSTLRFTHEYNYTQPDNTYVVQLNLKHVS